MGTIIVQETDENVLEVLRLALELEGFKVCAITDSNDILGLIELEKPHVVMLDRQMEIKACIEVFCEIRQRYPHLSTIALSCHVNIHEECSLSDFEGYVGKSFDLELLYTTLRYHIPKKPIVL